MKAPFRVTAIEDLLTSSLFEGCDASFIYDVLKQKAIITEFDPGSVIMINGKMLFASSPSSPSIAYIVNGKCLITSSSKTDSILRIAKEKEIIGLAGIFLDEGIKTKVIAYGGKTIIISIGYEDLKYLMAIDKSSSIRDNLFKMLATKISFLNKKIATLTGGSALKKLASFLLAFGKEEFSLDTPMKDLSSMLDIGRSSLYRGIDALEEKGAIKREGDKIKILDKNLLVNL